MTVIGRLEVTVKFSEPPTPIALDGGKTGIEIDCNGTLVKASLKNKAWNKAAAAMVAYADWVAAVRGEISSNNDGSIALERASIQVFEKKPKEAKAN